MSPGFRWRLFAAAAIALFLLGLYLNRYDVRGPHLQHVVSTPKEHDDNSRAYSYYRRKLVEEAGPGKPLPNGIPTYTVVVLNACVQECAISQIHLSCGWFSSAREINPRIFRRLGYNDCLVNDGRPLANGFSISFQYANSFPYRLAVSNATCHS
uniref:Protein TAPETUM DETERMINANT 1-like n=1 Tax=Ananas comosus var. bracteatus TaxID=296719 RepID=A0A6V7PXR5_ANACO|nr:unnamed protein product [Ananas comosus var. bracteatus]